MVKKTRVKFDGSCLKYDKITITHEKRVNIYTVYEINLWKYVYIGDRTLENFLSGTVNLIKNVDTDKYKFSGYGIGFDTKEKFSFPAGGFGKNNFWSKYESFCRC